MPFHKEKLRFLEKKCINHETPEILSDGHAGALAVTRRLLRLKRPEVLAVIDAKHLYGERIWEVYALICGQDINRFIYHIEMELPCQICGKLAISGIFIIQLTPTERIVHMFSRIHGKPGSYWALEKPPKIPNYFYPIKVIGEGILISPSNN